MDINDVKILETHNLYQGFIKIANCKLQHKLFAGGWSEPFSREILQRYDAVAILPYDPKLDKVVMIEQFRIGALRDKNGPWLLEIVAGIIDKEHSKEKIAAMETKEEAGLEIQQLIPITEYWSSPGASTEQITLYCAIVDAENASGIHGVKEENEDIRVHTLTSTEAFAGVKAGRINNAATIIALQWLELNIDKLR